jgi:aminoglycoside phosphotransferase (APT) family kinase protein
VDLKSFVDQTWGLTCTALIPIEEGLINHTWLLRTPTHNYILQKINAVVFQKPEKLQEQLQTLSKALQLIGLVPLEFIEVDEKSCFVFENAYYRLQKAIWPSTTLKTIDVAVSAQAASALSAFHLALNQLDFSNWEAPIPDFLDVQKRITAFDAAKQHAEKSRLELGGEIIEKLNTQLPAISAWQALCEAEPKVLIHGDPKLSNYLFTQDGKKVRALIDWDTIQLGCVYYDYADMVRSFCGRGEELSAEEELFRSDIFEALLASFDVDDAKFFSAARGLILVQSLRFLTDYLNNDIYYKVKDDLHNLRRAANQLNLAQELEAYWLTTRRPTQ